MGGALSSEIRSAPVFFASVPLAAASPDRSIASSFPLCAMGNLSKNRLFLRGPRDEIERCFALFTPTVSEVDEHGCSTGMDFERVRPSPPDESFHRPNSAEGRSWLTAWCFRLMDSLAESWQPWWRRARAWQDENWGTGNTVDCIDPRESDDSVCFLTAHSPPLPLVLYLSSLFPSLHFRIEFLADADYTPSAFEFEAGKEIETARETHEMDSAEGKAIMKRLKHEEEGADEGEEKQKEEETEEKEEVAQAV